MKTLVVCKHVGLGASWLETDDAFALLFAAERETVAEVLKLEPGRQLFFTTAGELETSPRVQFSVRRIAWPSSRLRAVDAIGPVLALAVFLAGVFMVSR